MFHLLNVRSLFFTCLSALALFDSIGALKIENTLNSLCNREAGATTVDCFKAYHRAVAAPKDLEAQQNYLSCSCISKAWFHKYNTCLKEGDNVRQNWASKDRSKRCDDCHKRDSLGIFYDITWKRTVGCFKGPRDDAV